MTEVENAIARLQKPSALVSYPCYGEQCSGVYANLHNALPSFTKMVEQLPATVAKTVCTRVAVLLTEVDINNAPWPGDGDKGGCPMIQGQRRRILLLSIVVKTSLAVNGKQSTMAAGRCYRQWKRHIVLASSLRNANSSFCCLRPLVDPVDHWMLSRSETGFRQRLPHLASIGVCHTTINNFRFLRVVLS
jgi:hypothetical protein